MKNLLMVVCFHILVFSSSLLAMHRLAIFDISSIIKQDIDKKQTELVIKLFGKDSYRNLMKLGTLSHKVFGLSYLDMIKVLFGNKYKTAQEHKARVKFFDFLRGIPLDKKFPVILFERDELPPLMAGWVLGVYKPQEVIDIAYAYIDKQELDDEVKELFRALVFVTFTPEVMARSCKRDEAALRVVETCVAKKLPLYLVGHCDPASHEKLKEDPEGVALLEKFKDHIVFSYQTYPGHVTDETQFDDAFWLQRLGLFDITPGSDQYLFVDDGLAGDVPPHYSGLSKALETLLK